MPSSVSDSLADLLMRCVSITSWPVADISAAGALACNLREEIFSAMDSSSVELLLILRRETPTCVSVFSWPSTICVFLWARSTRGTIWFMLSA